MPRHIERDYKHFIDIISGRARDDLKKYIKTGKLFPLRAKDGKLPLPQPRIENPFFVYGEQNQGIKRGPGNKGDVIGQDPEPTKGGGDQAGEGMLVNVDLEDVLMLMQEELKLPDMKPKLQAFDEVERKYNNISLVGPESLRNNRRTMREALKRLTASGEADKLYYIPGQKDPVKLILPINSDKRYRQYKEKRKPSSNAVIFFARDGSGSMGVEHCEIINDMCWWIDVWIRRFYKKVERCYFWHDAIAKEVDEKTFYSLRMAGGTIISSVFEKMAEQFENRFTVDKWNVYVFYFSDGENWSNDNEKVASLIKQKFDPNVVNLMAITQVLCGNYSDSFKKYVNNNLTESNLRTVSIGQESDDPSSLSESERGQAIMHAIKTLLGNKEVKESADFPY